MIQCVQSQAKQENPDFRESKRKPKEDNVSWLKRHIQKTDNTVLALFGGTDQVAFRVRVAQSYARHNLTPSHWSDIVFVKDPESISARTRIFEASLRPETGFGFPPNTNGIQSSSLQTYKDPKQFPNVATIIVPVPRATVESAVEQFQSMRHVVNGAEIIVAWLAHVWGIGIAGNPLLQGIGLPSAVLMEYAVGATNFDLTPGLSSRSSCPEAIWQAAKWWHRFYITKGEEGGTQPIPTKATQPQAPATPIAGNWCVDHIISED